MASWLPQKIFFPSKFLFFFLKHVLSKLSTKVCESNFLESSEIFKKCSLKNIRQLPVISHKILLDFFSTLCASFFPFLQEKILKWHFSITRLSIFIDTEKVILKIKQSGIYYILRNTCRENENNNC